MHLGKGLFARWAELDGAGAAGGVLDRSRGRERDIYARAVASAWPSVDHHSAFAWYHQEAGDPDFPLDRMTSRLLLAHVFVNWLGHDRDEAIRAFATLQYDDQKAAMLGFSWAGEDGEQLLRELARR